MPETKEGSWKAANAWWEQRKLAETPTEDDRVVRATKISNIVRDFSRLDEAARREAVEALLGAGSYEGLKAQAGSMLAGMEVVAAPGRTVGEQVDAWKALLRGQYLGAEGG